MITFPKHVLFSYPTPNAPLLISRPPLLTKIAQSLMSSQAAVIENRLLSPEMEKLANTDAYNRNIFKKNHCEITIIIRSDSLAANIKH